MFGRLFSFRKISDTDRQYYSFLKEIFGIRPNNIELYKLALIHRSASVFNKDIGLLNNERLEYLGDAILEAIVSDYLFIEFPEEKEGFLTQMRSKIVSRQTLNALCVKLGLDKHIVSHAAVEHVQKHLHGDALEAIIGAIYLDQGYDYTNRLVIDRILRRYLDLDMMLETETDPKSRLIEWCQKNKHSVRFETNFDETSSPRNPQFRSTAYIDDMELGYGLGDSKKQAEQRASSTVMEALSDDFGDDFLDWVDRKFKGIGEESATTESPGAQSNHAAPDPETDPHHEAVADELDSTVPVNPKTEL